MEEREWELLSYETDYLGEDWYIDYGFSVSRNKEGQLKVDAYFYDDCMEEDAGHIECLIEDYEDCEDEDEAEDAKEYLDSVKVNEYKFNSPEELFEAIDKNKLPIRRGLSVTDLIKYSTLKNLCKRLDYKHLMG